MCGKFGKWRKFNKWKKISEMKKLLNGLWIIKKDEVIIYARALKKTCFNLNKAQHKISYENVHDVTFFLVQKDKVLVKFMVRPKEFPFKDSLQALSLWEGKRHQGKAQGVVSCRESFVCLFQAQITSREVFLAVIAATSLANFKWHQNNVRHH